MARCLMYFRPECSSNYFGISVVHQRRDVPYRTDGNWMLYWVLSDGKLPEVKRITDDKWKFRINVRRILKWE